MNKTRSIASFGELAETEVNDKVNVNVNDNINLKQLLSQEDDEKQLIGVYFEPEIAKMLKNLSKKRGDQSKIVNEAVKRLLQANGMI